MEKIIIWGIYSLLEGVSNAFMYNVKSVGKTNKINEHIIFTIQRAVVLFGLIGLDYKLLVVAILIFSFLFNGMYYTTREWLSPGVYPKTWFSWSTTSTAITEKFDGPITRTVEFVFGILTYILWH